MWYLYIATFSGGKLYTGITNNLVRRIRQHYNGTGAKSLRGKGPIQLVYTEVQTDIISAGKREKEVKGWSHEKKVRLIQGLH